MNDDDPNQTSKLGSAIETAAKVTTFAAVIVYVCGFLVTSIHHSQFGITETTPFKPRVISAGGWFILLTGMAVANGIWHFDGKRIPWSTLSERLFGFWVGCCSFGLLPTLIFNWGDTFKIQWVEVIAVSIMTMIITMPWLPRIHPRAKLLCSLLFTAVCILWSARNIAVARHCTYSWIILWFFTVGLMTALEFMSYEPRKLADLRSFNTFFIFLVVLFAFANLFYPNIKASWGGGAPIAARIYFGKDSLILPGSSTQAFLLDAGDAGFYINTSGDNTPIFVPRSAVALIEFSNTGSTAKLLQPTSGSKKN